MYIAVGVLFLLASALFIFSKKLPNAKGDSNFVKAPYAVKTLASVTAILILIFSLIFNNYRDLNHVIEASKLTENIGLKVDDELYKIDTMLFNEIASNDYQSRFIESDAISIIRNNDTLYFETNFMNTSDKIFDQLNIKTLNSNLIFLLLIVALILL